MERFHQLVWEANGDISLTALVSMLVIALFTICFTNINISIKKQGECAIFQTDLLKVLDCLGL